MSVLVVDDQPELLTTTSMLLQVLGFEVLTAHDADSAIRIIDDESQAVDVLLSDVVMPGMNGIALAHEVRRRRPDVSIVLMSGYVPHSTPIPPSWQFLSKPFVASDLVRVLRKAR